MQLFLIITIHICVLFNLPTSKCEKTLQKLCRPEDEIILMDNDGPPIDDAENTFCVCMSELTDPWGLQTLYIDCQERKLKSEIFEAENLPPFAETLDLSWNLFEFVPNLNGTDLVHLDASHNVITTVDDSNFAGVPNLETLNLRSNKIAVLPTNAFAGLRNLRKIDLSHNKLTKITGNVFSTMPNLRELILSHNHYLNETFGRSDIDLYVVLGVTTQLQVLRIETSNLNAIDITHGVGLKELHLRGNGFILTPEMPRGIEFIDLSQNPIQTVGPKFLPHLINLHKLYLEDMPNLKSIQDHGLFGLPNLRELSIQGSWNLVEFSGIAFGVNVAANEVDGKLEILNLRGTNLRTVNASLSYALANLKQFDLSGNPMVCDCMAKWILDLNLETNGKCVKPSGLRGRMLSNIRFEELKCKRWPEWTYKLINGMLILVMLIICAVLTWCIVMGVKPLRNHGKLLHKVGEASPYARITIEPNLAEIRR